MTYSPKYSWMHKTEPEKYAGGRKILMPRGKLVGGSSSINGMIYIRGNKKDYDDWVACGADGWSWSELLPYFIRTEDQSRINNDLHGKGGVLPANDIESVHPVTKSMIQAAVESGLEHVDDFNDGKAKGVGTFQVNYRNGRRSSIATNAIEPAMLRSNFKLIMKAMVQRIIFEGKRASAVEYKMPDGSLHYVRAKHEILVCAGAIQSPQLLMISGVGPEEHLKSLGIPVISDLPGVGKNLQDHVCAPMSWKLKDGVKSLNSKFRGVGLIRSVIKYFISKNGPMTSPPAEFGCYIKSNKDLSYNEIQIFGLPVTGNPDLTNSGSKAPVPDSFDGMTLAPYQVRPFSRGHIRLKSRDINDHPALTMNYLNDERDRRALIFALRWLRDLAQQPSLKKIIEGEVRPGAGVESDDEWLSWISQSLSTGYHPVGTCRMGREDDIDAVCTSDFKVRGVQGLRVIDASVMPNIICGNTNAIAVVIGDKGADLVLGKTPLKPMAS